MKEENMERDYKTFKAEDFLEDAFFNEWIKNDTLASRAFWNHWEDSVPANLTEMQLAKAELRLIQSAKRILPVPGEEVEVWDRILKTLDLQNDSLPAATITSRKTYNFNFSFLTAAASIILLVGIVYFYFPKKSYPSVGKVIPEKVIQQDLQPGGNKAILTLSDGKEVILDNSQNGSLGNQGNATLIKLGDGRIAYKNIVENFKTVVYNTISTPRGGQYQVDLADGSKVWLNAASSLRFPTQFSGKKRIVEVTGEAYFEVAHNGDLPFEVILTNGSKIEVLGTHFNVMSYQNEKNIETTLFEGSVRFIDDARSLLIKPGEQVIMNESSSKLFIEYNVEQDAVLAWKNGKFYFNEIDIQTVMNQIARWYDVEVEYKGAINKVFAGTISRNVSASTILKILEATGGVSFKIEGKKIIVSP